MSLKVSFKNKSVVFTWLVSYVLILLIQLLITGAMYFRTKKEFENEINRSNAVLLERIQQHMDNLVTDVERLGKEIALDVNIQNVLYKPQPASVIEQMQVNRAAEIIQNYRIVNKGINHIYIHLRNMNRVIGPGITVSDEDFPMIFGKDIGLSQEEWKKITEGTYRGTFIRIEGNKADNRRSKSIAYVISLPVINSTPVFSGNLVLFFEDSVFFEDAKGVEENNDGKVFILNSNNEVMASLNVSNREQLPAYDALTGDSGIYYSKVNGEEYAFSYISSRIKGWKYVSGIPSRIFWKKAQFIGNMTMVALLLSLVLGAVVTWYSLRKNYSPIRALVDTLQGKTKLSFDKQNNEYGFIQQVIDRAMEENMEIHHQLKQQNRALRASFLASLLKGKERGLPREDLLKNYDISFDSEYFAAMAIFVESIDTDFFAKTDIDSKNIYKMVCFIITNVVEELCGPSNKGYVVDVDDLLVCLLNIKAENVENWKEWVSAMAKKAQEFIQTHYKIQLLISVSMLHKNIEAVPEVYKEALEAMEYKKVMDIDRLLFYDEIDNIRENKYFYPIDREYQLINCVKAGDFKSARESIEEIFQRNFSGGQLSLPSARCLMNDLVSTIIKTISEIEELSHNRFVEELNPVGILDNCKTVKQMKTGLLKILEEVCNYIYEARKNTDFKIRDRVAEIVNKHYNDVNFSIQFIADELNISVSYLSRTFKEQTGKGLLEYITMIRMEKAKELLKNSTANIEEIARQVGYENTRSFTRAFKRVEGLSPGKFKL